MRGGAHRGGVEYIELNGQTLEDLTRSEEFAGHLDRRRTKKAPVKLTLSKRRERKMTIRAKSMTLRGTSSTRYVAVMA